jgi:hypothetical protein
VVAPPAGTDTRPLEIELLRAVVLVVLAALAILIMLPALIESAVAGS